MLNFVHIIQLLLHKENEKKKKTVVNHSRHILYSTQIHCTFVKQYCHCFSCFFFFCLTFVQTNLVLKKKLKVFTFFSKNKYILVYILEANVISELLLVTVILLFFHFEHYVNYCAYCQGNDLI